MIARLSERRTMEMELRCALEENQLQVHYQPQVALPDRRIVGVEALLRWPHPQRGWISPAEFIPLAEEAGLIHAMGEWVLQTACADAQQWGSSVRLGVNLSPIQFQGPDLAGTVQRILTAQQFDPQRLEIEITEGVLLHDHAMTHATLQALKTIGVSIAMDDFGTGYSSLGHLRRFPFDRIKIDRSFIIDLAHDPNARAIVRAIIALACSLSMPVIAEGVETEEQTMLLLREGCREAQGYHFGKPVSADRITELLASRAAA